VTAPSRTRARVLTAASIAAVALPVLVVSVLAGAGPAPAQTATTGSGAARIAQIRANADSAIQRRLATLSALARDVDGDQALSAANQAPLDQLISQDTNGLTALKARIDTDTTYAALVSDARSIVTAYRVYVLVVPQVHLAAAADTIVDVSAKLTTIESHLQSVVSSRPNLPDLLADAEARTAAARTTALPVPGEVLALTPSGYPGTQTTLHQARSSVATARDDLTTARRDLDQIIDGLRHPAH